MILTASLFILAKKELVNGAKTTPRHFGRDASSTGIDHFVLDNDILDFSLTTAS